MPKFYKDFAIGVRWKVEFHALNAQVIVDIQLYSVLLEMGAIIHDASCLTPGEKSPCYYMNRRPRQSQASRRLGEENKLLQWRESK
jgi:hypothetical protein